MKGLCCQLSQDEKVKGGFGEAEGVGVSPWPGEVKFSLFEEERAADLDRNNRGNGLHTY